MKKNIFILSSSLLIFSIAYLTQFSTNWTMLSILLPDFRLPRLFALFIAAIALGVSGLLIQTLTENPLADNGTLGITSGASAGVVLCLLLINLLKLPSSFKAVTPLFAILGGLIAFSLVYFLAIRRNLSNSKILLVGIGLTALFQGFITIAQLSMNAFDFEQVAVWLAGDPWQVSYQLDVIMFIGLILVLLLIVFLSRKLEVLSLGEEVAVSLGLDTKRMRLYFYIFSLILSIFSVLLVGGLAFVGLIAPHIARRLSGFHLRSRLLMTSLVAMILLLFADLVAQVIIRPSSLPLGFVVAFIGAPYYIYLIQKDL
ncbi:MAG: iron ABC transporter permease [Streptococcaceae bacterium]|jgi:iron complex transport system permease protein|nr:iron ABC transporter permease [Streptococcaceae bacterium]